MDKFKIYIDPDIGYSVTNTNDEFIFATETKDKAKEIISALEKQIPKKPIYKFTDSTGDMFYDCQICGEYVTHSGTQAKKNFCSNCGQKLDWRSEDE